jgi:hypothetical protein
MYHICVKAWAMTSHEEASIEFKNSAMTSPNPLIP